MTIDSQNTSKKTIEKDDDEIDLMALLWVLLRGWKVVVFFALLGLIIGILYSRYVNPTFKSDAMIQIEENSQGIAALGESISDLVGSEVSKAQTEAELIRSRMILEPVVKLLHLRIELGNPNIDAIDRIKANHIDTQMNTPKGVSLKSEEGRVQVSQFEVSRAYLNRTFTLTKTKTGFVLTDGFDDFEGQIGQAHKFRGTDGQVYITVNELPSENYPITITKQSLKATIDDVNSALSVVEQGKQTGIIKLSMTGSSQEQVTSVLNQIVLSYIDQNQSRGSEETTRTLTFMQTQIPALKDKLENSESIFNEFRKKYGTIDVAKEAELLLTENSQIDTQLNELKLKKADLTTYYTNEHPLVVQINEQLTVLNSRKREIDNTIADLPEIQREFLKLSEDTAINREIYLTLLKNYEQLKIVKAGQIGFARIIDLPINTYKAIAPKKLQIIVLALLLGGMLGTMLVLLKNLLRNVVKDPESIEGKTGVPVVATIPRSPLLSRIGKNKQAGKRLLAHLDHNSLSYEAIKSLRTSLMFSMPKQANTLTAFEKTNDSNELQVGQQARVILITGESPGVGKSFISANLSEVFAQLNKKVLVIDADMRLGELHKLFNLSQDQGLADYLTEGSSRLAKTDDASPALTSSELNVESFIHSTGMDGIDFMPRGRHPHNPVSLLMSDRFAQLMTALKTHYDYIVIDSPPILAASDAIILAQNADKVLMVTRYDKSIEGQVVYAVKQMHKANIQVDGIILNDVQQGPMDKYSYHYSYAYGDTQ
ncbi:MULTISPECIES: polysaccharide biosynthesis tyrosine autokinase [unclassified Psychrobacter]|uniref:polysaccharide biosynthesis tyrosine autokinase n=1 Tax=unclassified Psychrobacter TaxID=196806 RepID=UPI0025B50E76|nr:MULTISPECIES: polysaccharide biosynthesis tyrosine autokinase [unclassified Psychrobacter]MDN3453868.1 polysaccharide biosynthesis tyrosine autokinase [Psychrobacter sp. APC 3350]MDN3502060.1 polysaccharide biosynthesis tyrosine autokinase [Psychrobacter sp. 5A.1]